MKKPIQVIFTCVLIIGFVVSCSKKDISTTLTANNLIDSSIAGNKPIVMAVVDPFAAIKLTFGNNIDPTNLSNYANQTKPNYILKDNTGTNPITNQKATLGRVLFYDKNLSTTNTCLLYTSPSPRDS